MQIVDDETLSILFDSHKSWQAEVGFEIDILFPLVEINPQIVFADLIADNIETVVDCAMD